MLAIDDVVHFGQDIDTQRRFAPTVSNIDRNHCPTSSEYAAETRTTSLGGGSRIAAPWTVRRNRCACRPLCPDFPGTSRKTSSEPKVLISLGLWEH